MLYLGYGQRDRNCEGEVTEQRGRCIRCTDHRRHALATFRSQRHISLHSTETKCRRLQSALLVVMCTFATVAG